MLRGRGVGLSDPNDSFHTLDSHPTTLGGTCDSFPLGGKNTNSKKKKKTNFFPRKIRRISAHFMPNADAPVVVDFDFAAGKKIFSKRHGLRCVVFGRRRVSSIFDDSKSSLSHGVLKRRLLNIIFLPNVVG